MANTKGKNHSTHVPAKNLHSVSPPLNTVPSDSISFEPSPTKENINNLSLIPHNESNLLRIIRSILSKPISPLQPSPMTFEFSNEAALKNAITLASFDFSIEAMLNSSEFTSLHTGCEFREIETILPILELHKYGPEVQKYILTGVNYDLDPTKSYSETMRLEDLKEALTSEINNKSALTQHAFVESAIKKEVERGWSFVLPRNFMSSIKDQVGFIPLGTSKQYKVKDGKICEKLRLTQDCSQTRVSGFSLNAFSVDDVHSPEINSDCYFGGCLNRILLRILSLRLKYPDTPILLSKHDLDSAYRRMHIRFDHALLECWTWRDYMIVNSRMPFGGKPMAKKFSNMTDIICDLSQWIIDDPSWDPDSLHSSISEPVPPSAHSYGGKAKANRLMNEIDCGQIYVDSYIDDFATIAAVTDPRIILKAQHAVPLALDTLFRPTHEADSSHLQRNQLLAPEKMLEEGNLSEIKTILGVTINTASLRIFLPINKAMRYMIETRQLIRKYETKQLVSAKEIESVLGKFVHVSQIAPEGHMFLSRLRYRLKSIQRYPAAKHKHLLQPEENNDLKLWTEIIQSASNIGRPINVAVNTVPSFAFVSDAAESNGLGGWLSFGPAWRFELPDHLQGIFSSNLLELIAAFWSLKFLFRFVHYPVRVHGFADNSATLIWLVRNRFDPISSPAHEEVCRSTGRLLMDNQSSAETSHVVGKSNIIADSLSRDTNLPILYHEQMLRNNCGTALPRNFKITQSDDVELLHFLERLALLMPSKRPIQMPRTRSELQRGSNGQPTLNQVEFPQPSSSTLRNEKKFESASPFVTRCDMENWAQRRKLVFNPTQSETSSHRLTRPFATMISTPHSSTDVEGCVTLSANC